MAKKAKLFSPSRQIAALRRLSDARYITDLSIKKGLRNTYYWGFRMAELSFRYDKEQVDVDFRHYQVKMVYNTTSPPRFFITEPNIPRSTQHLYADESLCLYKPSNWQWQNDMQFDEELFPNICTWLYNYEVWCNTGNWYGEEAKH